MDPSGLSKAELSGSSVSRAHVAKDAATTIMGMIADEYIQAPKGISASVPLGIGAEILFQSNKPDRQSSDMFGSFVGSVAGGASTLFVRAPLAGAAIGTAVSEGASSFYETFLTGPPRAEEFWKDFQPSTMRE